MSLEAFCASSPSPECPASLRSSAVVLSAVACGLSVANVYYAQPLLDAMARDFGIAPAAIGFVVTLTQIGYALGLIIVVPIGDLIDARILAITQTSLCALVLAIVGTTQSESILFAGMAAVGLLSTVVQVLVAHAAALAEPARRGQVVGTVTSGVVIGILGARFLSGVLSDLGGWRAVYLTSAALSVLLALLLFALLPGCVGGAKPNGYLATIRSIPALFRADAVLRLRGVLALLVFATFSTFWTALVLPLSGAPFALSHTQIGLFGLVGLAGALAAAKSGRLSDRGLCDRTTSIGLAILLAAWGPIALLPVSITALVGGVLLLDLAVQSVHVTNQSVIVARYPEARSRLVGGYMAFYSVGSAIGAIAGTSAFAAAGWNGVCAVGATFSGTALLVWLSRAVLFR